MRICRLGLAFNFLLMSAAVPGMAADVEAGKTAFKKCALCHTTEAGKNKLGPSLFGVVGRKAAACRASVIPVRTRNSVKLGTPRPWTRI